MFYICLQLTNNVINEVCVMVVLIYISKVTVDLCPDWPTPLSSKQNAPIKSCKIPIEKTKFVSLLSTERLSMEIVVM